MTDGYSADDGARDYGFPDAKSANEYLREFGTIELPPTSDTVVLSVEKYEQLKSKSWTDEDMINAHKCGNLGQTAKEWLEQHKQRKEQLCKQQ